MMRAAMEQKKEPRSAPDTQKKNCYVLHQYVIMAIASLSLLSAEGRNTLAAASKKRNQNLKIGQLHETDKSVSYNSRKGQFHVREKQQKHSQSLARTMNELTKQIRKQIKCRARSRLWLPSKRL